MQPLDSAGKPTDLGSGEEPDSSGGIDPVFCDWATLGDSPSLYHRVLVSIVAVSYCQTAATGDLKAYLGSLSAEARQAYSDRADRLLANYAKEIRESLRQDQIETTWVDAAKFGLKAQLDDFADAQNQSFRDLNNYVRDKTSLKSQAWVAFGVALALAILVTAVRPVKTIWDDIRSVWAEDSGGKNGS